MDPGSKIIKVKDRCIIKRMFENNDIYLIIVKTTIRSVKLTLKRIRIKPFVKFYHLKQGVGLF